MAWAITDKIQNPHHFGAGFVRYIARFLGMFYSMFT